MADCRHCGGTGRCQNDFHSGVSLLGSTDRAGQNHPGLIGSMFSDCPSCGDGNTEWRPECPHCNGTGKDGTEWTPFGPTKKLYLGGGESVKQRRHRLSQESSVGGGEGGFWDSLTDKAATIGAGVGALCGLLAALESASSVGGYLAYIAIGAMAGAFLTSAFMVMLPWMVGLGLLVLLLKACTG